MKEIINCFLTTSPSTCSSQEFRTKFSLTETKLVRSNYGLQKRRDELLEHLEALAVKQDQWMETAELSLNFARHAREWFKIGTNDQKRTILLTLGLHPTLENKILRLDLLKPLEVIQAGRKMLMQQKLTIAPNVQLAVTAQTLEVKLSNPVWGDWLDEYRTQCQFLQLNYNIPNFEL